MMTCHIQTYLKTHNIFPYFCPSLSCSIFYFCIGNDSFNSLFIYHIQHYIFLEFMIALEMLLEGLLKNVLMLYHHFYLPSFLFQTFNFQFINLFIRIISSKCINQDLVNNIHFAYKIMNFLTKIFSIQSHQRCFFKNLSIKRFFLCQTEKICLYVYGSEVSNLFLRQRSML